jgi:hypothetical protein
MTVILIVLGLWVTISLLAVTFVILVGVTHPKDYGDWND